MHDDIYLQGVGGLIDAGGHNGLDGASAGGADDELDLPAQHRGSIRETLANQLSPR